MKPSASRSQSPSASPLGELLRPVVESFREELAEGKEPSIEARLQRAPAAARPELCRLLILEELRAAAVRGETVRPEAYLDRFSLLVDASWLALVRRSLSEGNEAASRSSAVDAVAWGFERANDTERTLDATRRFDRADDGFSAKDDAPIESSEDPTTAFVAAPSGARRIDAPATVSPPASYPSPASLPCMLGKYRLLKLIGKGGFGDVYLAEDPQLDRKVALKTPRIERSATGEASDSVDGRLEALLDEARNAAKLERIEGVIPIYDAGRIGDVGYIVTPYVEGGSLADLLQRGRLPLTEALRLFATVCEIVDRAHRAGWTHRDLKPSNILVGDDGRIFLTDFGLSAPMGNRERPETQGTPRYMAPEIARLTLDGLAGKPPAPRQETVDGRADLYSLGVTFYQLLTGTAPFQAERLREALTLIVETTPVAPCELASDVPLELSQLCMRLMEKDPAKRPDCAGEVAQLVRRFVERSRLDESPEQAARRRRYVAFAIGAAGALMLLAVALFWLLGR